MSSLAFVTHPSVRIKGTENSYTPSQCLDEHCPVKVPHLHCPFCVKTDAYQDPVILKAHYRVKHVDKGIEFAGLKILRCCDQCDIIGIIKGEKRFKGAHWHCYRCRNGFNRRDEAIKHYKTHFRNPQTTFQIQITQDLNSAPDSRSHEDHSGSQDAFSSIENSVQEIIQPSLSQSGLTTVEQNVIASGALGLCHNGGVKKIKVKHELNKEDSGDHEDEETIMIIQGEQIESAFANHLINSGELTVLNRTVDSNLSWEIRYQLEKEEKNIYKAKAEEYKAQVDILEQQVAHLESQLSQQIQLKFHELSDILNSGDFGKQGLGQQLLKFLEQCQPQSHGSIAVIEDDSHISIKQHQRLKPEDGIIQEIEQNANSLQESEQQHLETECTVAHLSEIPNGFQVVCTTSEGHVVVTRHPNSAVVPSMSEGDTVIPIECQDNFCSSSAISSSTVAPEHNEVIFSSHQISSQIKEESVNSEFSGCVVSQVEQVEVSVGGDHTCLLEVVSTAEDLASLDTDITVSSSSFDGHDSQAAFTIGAEDEQRVVTSSERGVGESREEDAVRDEQFDSTEPPIKRSKVT